MLEFNDKNYYIFSMNSLKSTLSTQDHQKSRRHEKGQADDSLLKGVNKSKSQSLWALDRDSDDIITEESLNTDNLLRILNEKIESAFKKDNKGISEITFQRIIEEFQDEAGGARSELAYLMVVEDKLTDILEFARENLKPFLAIFSSMLEGKLAKMRKKQKKTELNNFDYIVNCNFKKKTQEKVYLKVEQSRPFKNSKEMERKASKQSRKQSGSGDKKLNRLFSKDKKQLKQRQNKDQFRRGDQEGGINATVNPNNDESISFSAALSTNVTVKTRKRKDSNDKKKEKPKKKEENSEDKQGDEAFMFFRPKKQKQ